MKLQNLDYLRIYARKEILAGKSTEMEIVYNTPLNYRTMLAVGDQLCKRIENLVISENEDSNSICIRPLVVPKGDCFSIQIRTPQDGFPLVAGITQNGESGRNSENLYVINNTRLVLWLKGNGVEYEVTPDEQGSRLLSECEGLERLGYFEKRLSDLQNVVQEGCQKQKDQVELKRQSAQGTMKELERLTERYKAEKEIADQLEEQKESFITLVEEENRRASMPSDYLEKREKKLKDLDLTEEEMEKYLKRYQIQTEFIRHVAEYYQDDVEKAGIISENLQNSSQALEKVRSYFEDISRIHALQNRAEEVKNV